MAVRDITPFGEKIAGQIFHARRSASKMPKSAKWLKGLEAAGLLWNKMETLKYSEMIDEANLQNRIDYAKQRADITRLNEWFSETAPVMQRV